MGNILLETTEQLYKAKAFLFVISILNTLVTLLATYALSRSGMLYFSLLSALVFMVNVMFLWISVKQWRASRSSTIVPGGSQ